MSLQARSGERALISLILVTYNSAGLLPAFFEALADTSYAPYELIAVDNASADGTATELARRPGVRLLANAENVGFGRACNQGARMATGSLLVFLNPDVLATPGWLDVLTRRMEEHPDAAIVAPQSVAPGQVRAVSPAPGRLAEEAAAVPGCAMMMRRAAWEALGGFDERIFLYWEDTELCWRAWMGGWRVLEDLEARVVHTRGASGGGARWDAEATKNGLYAHLKLLSWPLVARFGARQALKTALRLAVGRGGGLLHAWRWNLTHLGETLARRRELRRHARGDLRRLERLIAAHAARQRREHTLQRAARRGHDKP
jgi:N-acetylglucosaminyl-diphospho-decaprenol L-rhamnosyltransferase